ncbi:integral membrane [Cordyceps militaris]|uniref:Integral membrane n=1 Tax=Cordyceps militaris TaxID=73501 RepID=A0A2H4SE95_CORMI|nr:integral membrane [Cordyceps militaris]
MQGANGPNVIITSPPIETPTNIVARMASPVISTVTQYGITRSCSAMLFHPYSDVVCYHLAPANPNASGRLFAELGPRVPAPKQLLRTALAPGAAANRSATLPRLPLPMSAPGRASRAASRPGHHSRLLHHAHGPVSFLNPTRGVLQPTADTPTPQGEETDAAAASPARPPTADAAGKQPPGLDGVHFLWRSRDNRKGRHPIQVHRRSPSGARAPRRSSHPREVLRGVVRTLTEFPVWDISWLVACIFTWGSVVWVINGFFAWLPLVRPSTKFPGEADYGGGITAFIGAILFFELGSVLLILEAINTNDAACFGWAVEELLAPDEHDSPGGGGGAATYVASPGLCQHHHQNKHNLVGAPQSRVLDSPGGPSRRWKWRVSWQDLRHRYLYELGFLAGAAQLIGATIFGVAGFTALPGIAEHLTPQWRLNAAYWIPQVVGGCGFVVSGLLYMLETQDRWWRPAPRLLGWHIAFWNLIGAVGFTLCGALGMAYGSTGAQYQAALATFWGSWAFLIGSYLQLYESLNKHPVEDVKATGDKEAPC